MLKPKKNTGARRVLIERAKAAPINRCKNCGNKIDRKHVYCDSVCRAEHSEHLKRQRRPEHVTCAACGKEIDPLSRDPGRLKAPLQFCDSVCVDLYRRQNGHYQKISEAGNAKNQEYKAKHGSIPGIARRAEATRKNNTIAPPRSKNFARRGKVWGYEAHIQPNGRGDGYIAFLPDLPEAGTVEAKTAKKALQSLRQRFVEARNSPE